VHRTWKEAGLKPHRLERYMASNDPDFETKAADIIGLYLNPPRHAAVFCVDEKTAIQALDRLDPVLPLSPGRAERHGFEYFRHGTLSLYAALDTATGRVHGKTAARHPGREFVAFLKEVVSLWPGNKQIHIILDNLSAHKTIAVREFLEKNPRVHFHFTPTYSSWLNQVELRFAKIERGRMSPCAPTRASFPFELCRPWPAWNGIPRRVGIGISTGAMNTTAARPTPTRPGYLLVTAHL